MVGLLIFAAFWLLCSWGAYHLIAGFWRAVMPDVYTKPLGKRDHEYALAGALVGGPIMLISASLLYWGATR